MMYLPSFRQAGSELDRTKFIQVLSDGPNVNLKFLELLCEKRQDEDLKKLILIGTCGLYTVSRAFQNAEQSTDWNVKKILMAMHKIFEESPSHRADYERITQATENDYPLHFCATRWVENAAVAKRAFNIWPKIVAIVDYWHGLPKSKQPGKGDPKKSKSYHVLLQIILILLFHCILNFLNQLQQNLMDFLDDFRVMHQWSLFWSTPLKK